MKFFLKKQMLAFFICLSTFSSAANMQDTGFSPPSPFYQFNLPIEALKVARRFLPTHPKILDCGAFDGKESCQMSTIWKGRNTNYCFEPVKQIYKELVSNTADYSNIYTYNLALGDAVGRQLMYLSRHSDSRDKVSMSSSLLQPKEHLNYSEVEFSGEEWVDVTTLDVWAETNKIDKIDMLWLDMQGFELSALKASPKILSTVSVILTEVEFVEAYEGQPLYHEVKVWLEEQGFQMIGGNFSFPKKQDQWFGDALFVRKELLKKGEKR